MRPYKTSENRIEGVVLPLVDIDSAKRAQEELEHRVQERSAELRSLLDPLPDFILTIDAAGRLLYTHHVRGAGQHASCWFDYRVGPVWRNGQIIALSVLTIDITEQKQAEESVRRARAEAP